MSDCDRILDRLKRGPLTSYEMRTTGLTANPSQRINELRDAGYRIDAEHFMRDTHGTKRPCCRYTFRGHTVHATPEPTPGAGGSLTPSSVPLPASASHSSAATNHSSRSGGGKGAGGSSPLQLFEPGRYRVAG